MLIQAPNPSPTSTFLIHQPLFPRSASLNVSRMNGVTNTWSSRRELSRRMVVSAADDQSNSTANSERKRKVVEHICLLKTKENLTDEEEKDMLDYLYTTQYQMRGIVAISLGRISEENLENYTHAVYMRFQIKEDLAKFYENPFYLGVLKKHVMPYCHGLINVDYEAEVEDDILPIFRKGEEFNYGVEFVLLISFVDNAFGVPVQHALASLARLTHGFPSLIVQSTQGLNCNPGNKEFTHGVVIRFRSLEAFEIFVGSSEYKEVLKRLARFVLLSKSTCTGPALLNSDRKAICWMILRTQFSTILGECWRKGCTIRSLYKNLARWLTQKTWRL